MVEPTASAIAAQASPQVIDTIGVVRALGVGFGPTTTTERQLPQRLCISHLKNLKTNKHQPREAGPHYRKFGGNSHEIQMQNSLTFEPRLRRAACSLHCLGPTMPLHFPPPS